MCWYAHKDNATRWYLAAIMYNKISANWHKTQTAQGHGNVSGFAGFWL